MTDTAALTRLLTSLPTWSAHGLHRPLRPYQLEPAAAILDSVRSRRGDVFTVMMSRQAGKNELSAHLESFLLANQQRRLATLVKAAPTFKPQTLNSLLRLQSMLELCPVTSGRWRGEHGYIIRLGRSRILFFSAAPGASIVGATASVLLEVDEAQDVLAERYDRDLSPMASSTNATRVLYGTAWDDQTLLHRQIQAGLAAEKRDGRRRHFAYPWDIVADANPAYGRFVESERARLGADHPMFVTQYELRTLGQEAGLFTAAMVDQMHGDHERRDQADGSGTWVAGLDVAGASEDPTDELARERTPGRDSTVLLVGRVEWQDVGDDAREPIVRVEGVAWWTGKSHREQFEELVALLRYRWGVVRVAVDRTGIGAPLAEFLTNALGPDVVDAIAFTTIRKSELGYGLLAAAGGSRLRWFQHGPDDREAVEWWHQVACARREVRPNHQMRFYVPESSGHDDFLNAAALLVEAAKSATPPATSATIAAVDPDYDPRFRFERG